jgi:ABC-type branched-subunit amino acid transport system ATPase component
MLDAKNVSSGYEKMMIVKNVDIHVCDEEIVVIIGPNGSGKSTLMKTLFGILKPVEGEILFNGTDIAGMRPDQIVEKGIGYVPQLDNAFPSLTVQENLEMGAYTVDDSDEMLEEVFEIFPDLKSKRDTKALNLSGGQRQMVAVGRALMTDPSLLLLDEPTAGLSPVLVTDILDRIKQIREKGTSILLVEQNAKNSLEICDRGCVLVMGKKAFEGTGDEILDHKEIGRLYLGRRTAS